MKTPHLTLAAAASAAVVLVAPGTAVAAQDGATSFTVNTQFWGASSPVVAASGPLASCTWVTEQPGAIGLQTGPRQVLFVGTKLLECEGGTVTIGYEATFNTAGGRKTFGTWNVVASTLERVTFGGGRLTGDGARCDLLEGSEGCILDTFTGFVGS